MHSDDWVVSLLTLAQRHPNILADLPAMTWAERWGVYLHLRRLADGQD